MTKGRYKCWDCKKFFPESKMALSKNKSLDEVGERLLRCVRCRDKLIELQKRNPAR